MAKENSIPSPQIIRITSLHSVCSSSSRISTSQRSTAVSLSFSLVLPLKTDSNAYNSVGISNPPR